ncbi:FMN-binding protein [Lacrimispora sp. 210928-DFI.3.58]|uniref:FMN-binding protein n=1 Tax=Lacrimispora sp. 210928-DFI.3.58 TaxID=2883214 RepID=UPI0015B54652|nr:hypothetical protein [Lacrimispora sp. 210928-DFI.3.58]MCB7318447.1 hypothetical protein [Lacrimispora sp. 210928-DFI.3.58]
MSAKTKIVVLRMKEIIYTAIFVGLAIFLITLCFIMFRPKSGPASSSSGTAIYVPGVYSAALTLGSEQVNVEVAVDSDRINSIALIPLSEAVTTMYPLMQPTLDSLASQIVTTQSTENLTYPSTSRYTSAALLNAINTALDKAAIH